MQQHFAAMDKQLAADEAERLKLERDELRFGHERDVFQGRRQAADAVGMLASGEAAPGVPLDAQSRRELEGISGAQAVREGKFPKAPRRANLNPQSLAVIAAGGTVEGMDIPQDVAANAVQMLEKGGLNIEWGPDGKIRRITSGKVSAAADKQAMQKQQERITADIVTQDITRAMSLVDNALLPTTGAGGSFLKNIPGTSASDLSHLLDTVKANIGFDRLQRMRQSSPTGGALGAVSERENDLLQATMGNLEQAQTREQFLFNLTRIHNQILDTVHGEGKGPARLGAPGTSSAPDTTAAPVSAPVATPAGDGGAAREQTIVQELKALGYSDEEIEAMR